MYHIRETESNLKKIQMDNRQYMFTELVTDDERTAQLGISGIPIMIRWRYTI